MRVRLATYYKDHAPGDVVDLPPEEVKRLERDGYVNERLPDEPKRAEPAAKKAEPENKAAEPKTK